VRNRECRSRSVRRRGERGANPRVKSVSGRPPRPPRWSERLIEHGTSISWVWHEVSGSGEDGGDGQPRPRPHPQAGASQRGVVGWGTSQTRALNNPADTPPKLRCASAGLGGLFRGPKRLSQSRGDPVQAPLRCAWAGLSEEGGEGRDRLGELRPPECVWTGLSEEGGDDGAEEEECDPRAELEDEPEDEAFEAVHIEEPGAEDEEGDE